MSRNLTLLSLLVPSLAVESSAFAADDSADAPADETAGDGSSKPPLDVTLPKAEPQKSGKSGFSAKTMRDGLPAREVERGLVMPKGWMEFGFGFSRHMGVGAWGPDGEAVAWEDARWTYDTAELSIRYGLAPRVEMWATMPYHFAHLSNDRLNTDTSDHSLGDPHVGGRFRLYEKPDLRTSLALDVIYKGPAGKEAPGTFIGGPNNVGGFIFTTGTPDLAVGVGFKQQIAGPVAVVAHAAYNRRFSAVVQYLVETENLQFLGRMKPGDQTKGDVAIQLQPGPVAINLGASVEHRQESRTGTTSKGFFPSRNLTAVEGSDGIAVDLDASVVVQPSRGVDINLNFSLPVVGEDLMFFPIEDIHPTRGPTFGGGLEVRY